MRFMVLIGSAVGFALVTATLASVPANAGPGAGGGYKDQIQTRKKTRKKKSETRCGRPLLSCGTVSAGSAQETTVGASASL